MTPNARWRVTASSNLFARGIRIAVEIAGLMVVTVFLGFVLQRLHQANLSALFLLTVLIIAARHGLWPSILTSAVGFLAINFFFTAPYQTLRVSEDGDIATLVFFLAVATLGGNLASRLRTAIRRRDQALERISNLYDFSHRISGATATQNILQTLVDHLAGTLGTRTLVFAQAAGADPSLIAASSEAAALPGEKVGAANLRVLGFEPENCRQEWTIRPAAFAADGDGQLAIRRKDLGDDQQDLVRNLCSQAELAIDRVRLTADLESSRREAERARLRSALLTSVSHDLRTPLASIIGAASTLQELDASLAAKTRAELLDTVMGEARRLNGYIQNLLDMTRIEHGELRIRRNWEEPSDLIDAAIRLVRENWPTASIDVRIMKDVGLVHVHGELFVQALHNVLDNSVRYSPPGVPVGIACSKTGNALQIRITDTGPGLTEDQRIRIFDMFYRVEARDSYTGGTGLGLAITRGIIEAHGGLVNAVAGPGDTGTCIVIDLPDVIRNDAGGDDDE